MTSWPMSRQDFFAAVAVYVLLLLMKDAPALFASGNNKFTTSGGAWGSGFATLGMFNGQGKYYMEFKGASGTKIGYGISENLWDPN